MATKYLCSNCNLSVNSEKGIPNENVGGLCTKSNDFKHHWLEDNPNRGIRIVKLTQEAARDFKFDVYFPRLGKYRQHLSKLTEHQLRNEYSKIETLLAEAPLDSPILEEKLRRLRIFICKIRMDLKEVDEALVKKWLSGETSFTRLSSEIQEVCSEDGSPIAHDGICPKCGALPTKGLVKDAAMILKDRGFEVIFCKDWILATIEGNKRRQIFTWIARNNDSCYQMKYVVRSIIPNLERFKHAIQVLSEAWSRKVPFDSSGLSIGTLTVPGWHAYDPPERREFAIQEAIDAWGVSRVHGALKVVDNTFPRNSNRIYADSVKHDLAWFESNFLDAKSSQKKRHLKSHAEQYAMERCESISNRNEIVKKRILDPASLDRYIILKCEES